MPTIKIMLDSVSLSLTEQETSDWADGYGPSDGEWPCSTLAGKSLSVSIDRNGVNDFAVDGSSDGDWPADEMNAITEDYLRGHLLPGHPCYYVAIGQFSG